MKICIVGSRSISNRETVFSTIEEYLVTLERDLTDVTILSGGASGVDSLVGDFAKKYSFDFILFKPYHMLDKGAEFKTKYFFVRNRQMIDNADKVLVIWDGQSRGAGHAKEYAEKRGKDITTVIIDS